MEMGYFTHRDLIEMGVMFVDSEHEKRYLKYLNDGFANEVGKNFLDKMKRVYDGSIDTEEIEDYISSDDIKTSVIVKNAKRLISERVSRERYKALCREKNS